MTSKATTINTASQPLGFAQHNHGACMSEALAAAEARCASGGLRFTPVRRKVLEILLQDHRALGAYSILDRLREEGFGSQPPVAYRALDFLVANGLAHKIERLNAFIACVHTHHSHTPAFMICRLCDAPEEQTLELQPQPPIRYPVFAWKKKNIPLTSLSYVIDLLIDS